MPADRLTDEELAALEDVIKGRGPEAWALAWSKLESLVAEVRASRKALAEAAKMWDDAADEAERDYEPSTRVTWYRTQAARVRAISGGQS